MIRRFARDESGMTMALAIMMILLIGVMGAGLLAFVQNDLKSVIEANKGQKALGIADAGVAAAKAHLRSDSFREHYDNDPGAANDCAEGWRVGSDNWSKNQEGWTSVANPGSCEVASSKPGDDPDTPWPENYGVTKLFAGGRFHVTIECYVQFDDGTIGHDPCVGGAAGPAPEPTTPASEKKFFKITSTGYDTEAGDGAVRKIEAIYYTTKNTYVPIAYWTPNSIEFSGVRCVERMSFFAGRSITGATHGSPCETNPQSVIAKRSIDALYTDWYKEPYNIIPRKDANNISVRGAGFGAARLVCGRGVSMSNCENVSNTQLSVADGYHDYDMTTGNPARQCALSNCVTRGIPFKAKPTDPANQITFPFEEGNALPDFNGNPKDLVDAGLLEEMKMAAADQGNHKFLDASTTVNIGNTGPYAWPGGPGEDIRYFVEAKNGAEADVHFEVCTPGGPPWPKGVIVVYNGNFTFDNACGQNAGFEGVVIVIGDGITTGKYTQFGQYDLDGYVAASGKMTINGAVHPRTTIDLENLNSFYNVSLWSWRELYQ